MSSIAYIALGSNLGDSQALLHSAISRLASLSPQPLLVSSLWDTSPVDCPPGSPRFVNAAVALIPKPSETPLSLLAELQSIEREFGRIPKKQLNEARPLDLDLIAFGAEKLVLPELILPHPRAHLRKFVLAPMAEIASDFVLPGQKESVVTLLSQLKTEETLHRL